MAEIRMVIDDLDRGRKTLVALDQSNVTIDAAFWLLEDGRWQFYLHTPLTRKQSRKSLYKQIRDAIIDEPDTLRLREITLLSDRSDLLKTLRSFISTGGKGISDIRLQDNTVNGQYIPDALVYRL